MTFQPLSLYRGKLNKENKYYGPFVSVFQVRNIIDLARKIFQIRNCSDNEFKNRTRPCLEYQIKKCSAPCMKGNISKENYQIQIKNLKYFLEGKNTAIKKTLQELLEKASEQQEYTQAIFFIEIK